MSLTELVEIKSGVGALFVPPKGGSFFALEEQFTKRSTNKLAGDYSFPMETKHRRENDLHALRRLGREEAQLVNLDLLELPRAFLGKFELTEGVVLSAYYVEVPPTTEIIIGQEKHEVSNPRWSEFAEVLDAPTGPYPWRPGVREVVISCVDYLRNPQSYKPRMVRASQLQDQIPSEIFDLVEREGLSGREAWFQYCHQRQITPVVLPLNHLQSVPVHVA